MNSSESEEARWAKQLSLRQCASVYFDWRRWARDAQMPPDGDWVTWLLMGGRGAGKTRAGAEWVRALAADGLGPIALVGESITEAIAVMVDQVRLLSGEGFDQFHFYTLNQAELTLAVCRILGIRPATQPAEVAPA